MEIRKQNRKKFKKLFLDSRLNKLKKMDTKISKIFFLQFIETMLAQNQAFPSPQRFR